MIETIASPSLHEITTEPPLAYLDGDFLQRNPEGTFVHLMLPGSKKGGPGRNVIGERRSDVIQLAGEMQTINPKYRFKQQRYDYNTEELNGMYRSRVRKIDTGTDEAV